MKIIRTVVIASQFFMMAGCNNASTANVDDQSSMPTAKAPSANFAHHLADAGKFWDLKHLGDEYRDQGKYEEAVTTYNQALEKHAYSRPEQAIALDHIAMTYEAMGDLKNAADNYGWASEVTMNETRQKSLKAKADALRQKLSLQPSA